MTESVATLRHAPVSGSPARSRPVYGLQIARGIAALLVVVHHATLQLQSRHGVRFFAQGAAGVDIFFVISGFVIYLTGRRLSWHEFLGRRLARVVPLYWFFTLVKLAFMALAGPAATRAGGSALYIIASFFFVPAYSYTGATSPLITAGWTLNFEMYFYLISAAMLAFLPASRFAVGVTVTILVGIVLGLPVELSAMPSSWPAPTVLLQPICLGFLAGIWIAASWSKGRILPRWGAVAAITVGVVWFVLAPAAGEAPLTRVLLWGVPAASIMAGVVSLEPHVDFARWRPALFLGDASYAIYLSHTAVLPMIDKVLARVLLPGMISAIVMVAICLAAGCAINLFIERPLTRGASRLLRLKVRDPAPHTATAR